MTSGSYWKITRIQSQEEIQINSTFSMRYSASPRRFSAFRPKAFNSPQPFASFRSILRLRKISAGASHGLCLKESHPWIATFRMFFNHLSHPLPYVAQPADATFECRIPTLFPVPCSLIPVPRSLFLPHPSTILRELSSACSRQQTKENPCAPSRNFPFYFQPSWASPSSAKPRSSEHK